MAEWQELTLRTGEPEAVSEILDACGALAVTLKDAGDDPVLEPLPGETPLWPNTLVVGLFDGADERADIEQRLADGAGDRIISSHWDDLPEQVWERAWLAHFRPMTFGNALRVAPHGTSVPDDERQTLRLDPGLAFGTGTHPSTALCLHWLGDAEITGRSVLDFGCGSGILAIAAALRGAASVRACDIDPQAELATADNAQRNAVSIRLQACDSTEGAPFDLVLANILAGTLTAVAPTLIQRVAPGGTLLLAGLLATQADTVERAYPGFVFERRLSNEWCLLIGLRTFND